VAEIGPYLGTVPYVLREWASKNGATLSAYLAACIEGLRFVLDPANRAEVLALVQTELKVPPDFAAEILAVATDPVNGLAKDAAFDRAGLDTVLRLRAAFEGREPQSAEKYFDLTWHRHALDALQQQSHS